MTILFIVLLFGWTARFLLFLTDAWWMTAFLLVVSSCLLSFRILFMEDVFKEIAMTSGKVVAYFQRSQSPTYKYLRITASLLLGLDAILFLAMFLSHQFFGLIYLILFMMDYHWFEKSQRAELPMEIVTDFIGHLMDEGEEGIVERAVPDEK